LNEPRQVLCELIAAHGPSLCDEPGRCEGLLRDYCPLERGKVNVLVNALRERVVADLLNSSDFIPIELLLGRLTKRLEDHNAMRGDMAKWAVESWALALGKIAGGVSDGASESKKREAPPPPANGKLETPTASPLPDTAVANEISRASPPPLPRTLNVPSDHPTIKKALGAAHVGDTVLVHPGRYCEAIELKCGVNLRGTDRDQCILLRPDKSDFVISVKNCSSGSIACLTVSDVGATIPEVEKWLPDGISIYNSNIEVTGCQVSGMPGVGIFVSGVGAAPSLKGNWCHGNGQNGLDFAAGSQGVAQDNLVEKNKENGIMIAGLGTSPMLRNNRSRANGKCGILFENGGKGLADANQLEGNGRNGIEVSGIDTSPTLCENQSRQNGKYGLVFLQGATGHAERNRLEANESCGIAVFNEGTAPIMQDNFSARNGRSGIYFGKGATGLAERNSMESNRGDGISVFSKGTSPVLKANVCRNNGECGIWIQIVAAPTILENNVTEKNRKGGIKRGT
jgi:hypothetical protein